MISDHRVKSVLQVLGIVSFSVPPLCLSVNDSSEFFLAEFYLLIGCFECCKQISVGFDGLTVVLHIFVGRQVVALSGNLFKRNYLRKSSTFS